MSIEMNEAEFEKRCDEIMEVAGGDLELAGDWMETEMEKDPEFEKAFLRNEAKQRLWFSCLTEQERQKFWDAGERLWDPETLQRFQTALDARQQHKD
jgi:hypothetical protein